MSLKTVLKLATVQLFAMLTDQSNLYWATTQVVNLMIETSSNLTRYEKNQTSLLTEIQ